MIKKNTRKPTGAARIAVEDELDDATDEVGHESNGIQSDSKETAAKSKRTPKAKPEQQATGGFAVSDIKKAAAFANSIGGLDKAIAVLQILKVAKEVQ